jgi:hypothetical protein
LIASDARRHDRDAVAEVGRDHAAGHESSRTRASAPTRRAGARGGAHDRGVEPARAQVGRDEVALAHVEREALPGVPKRVAVIGAGVAGLVAADRLGRDGPRVDL